MTKYDFEILKLEYGELIWIMTETGEGFWGIYLDLYNIHEQSFTFRNHTKGREEVIYINKLQRLQREH